MQKEKETSMPIINFHAAGIDVGSRKHLIAVGQRPEDVREFGVSTIEHQKAIEFLKENGIISIAMESTGSYWQSLFHILQEANFEVVLVPGNQTKNARGKTDVKDCQWIQKLHTLGMLSGCFIPDEQTMRLRNIARHRNSLVETVAKYTNKISKALRLMNIRLDTSIRDVMGKTGSAIIVSIINGERDAAQLVKLVDPRVKKSQKEIEQNLQGQWNDELLYELKDCYELLKIHEQRIAQCDKELETILAQHPIQDEPDESIQLAKKQTKGKHSCSIDLSTYCYKILGTDIFAINGVGPGTGLNFISEMGINIYKFNEAKQFASWLRLTPNNRISGGKILSSRTEKSRNNLTKALRDAANAVGLSKQNDYLAYFFRKIAFKKGRGAAITATARKIAIILWNMIVKKEAYNAKKSEQYLDQIRQRKIKFLQRDIKKHEITIAELSMG